MEETPLRRHQGQPRRDGEDAQRLQNRSRQPRTRIPADREAAEQRAYRHDNERHRHRSRRLRRARYVGAQDEWSGSHKEQRASVHDPPNHLRPVGKHLLGITRRSTHQPRIDPLEDDDDHRNTRDEEVEPQNHDGSKRNARCDVEDAGRKEEEDQRQQLRHLIPNVQGDLLIGAPTQFDGMNQGSEVVVGEDHLGGLLRDFAPAPHCNTDVRLLQRGGIVDGVAGHRDDDSLALHELNEPKLVLWSNTPEDVEIRQSLEDLFVGEAPEVNAADRSCAETEILPDCKRCRRVIPGDHPDVDSGIGCDGDRFFRRRAKRIDDPDERSEPEALNERHRIVRRCGYVGLIDEACSERQHAKTLACHPIVRRVDLFANRCVYRRRGPFRPGYFDTASKHHVGRTFDQHHRPGLSTDRQVVDGGHELVGRVERNLSLPRVLPPRLHRVDAELGSEHNEGSFRRIPDDGAVVADRRIAVEGQAVREGCQIRSGGARDTEDRAVLVVTDSFDREPLAIRVHEMHHHLVHRQRAGLVRVDRTRRTEGFDIGEVLDNGFRFGELLRAICEHRLDERWQTRRDSGDRHGRAQQQQVAGLEAPGHPDRDDDRHRTPGDEAEDLGERIKLPLQR